MSNNDMLLRGLSPVTGMPGHEVLSGYDGFDQNENMLYSPTNGGFVDYNRDNSSSISPHSIRQKGNMST